MIAWGISKEVSHDANFGTGPFEETPLEQVSIYWSKASLIYMRTDNLRAVQLLLGHTKVESTVRYLGIEVNDALTISEQTEI